MNTFWQAIANGDEVTVAQQLSDQPDLAALRCRMDTFCEPPGHGLYVGDTPLHLAAAAQQAGCARLLLAHGAAPDAANRRGGRPLHYACDPRPHGPHPASVAAPGALIELLAQHGADLDARDHGGVAPLHRAVRARGVAAVAQLLAAGAPVNAAVTRTGTTALHLATQSTGASGTAGTLAEQLAIIRLLLAHGAEREAKDARGRTPADWAKQDEVLALLRGG